MALTCRWRSRPQHQVRKSRAKSQAYFQQVPADYEIAFVGGSNSIEPCTLGHASCIGRHEVIEDELFYARFGRDAPDIVGERMMGLHARHERWGVRIAPQ